MANYTAADVKRLRELTGSGMMDCKNALAESDGDFDKAVEQLRIKGAKDVGKRAERSTAEGLVVAKGGVLVEINSETDFVAKNEEFQTFADSVAAVAAEGKPADVDALKALDLNGKTVDTALQELSAKIGEKLEIRRVVSFDGEAAAEAARGAAMQVAALKAKYVTRDEVPEDVVASERRIAEETAREEGKPEQALPKIIEGRVNGFFKDVVLTEQSSVQDSKKTVKAILDEAGVKLTRFARFEVGAS
jgi:elongation factor Ts